MDFVNEAGWERGLRIVAGAVLLYLGFGGVVAGTWGTVLIIIGFIMLITGLVGWCPIHAALGTGTKKMAMETPGPGATEESFTGDTGPPEEPAAAEPAEEDTREERPPGSGGF